MKLRLLILLTRIPYPLEKGDKLRAFHQIKELSKHFEIILCCLSDIKNDPIAKEKLSPFCSAIYFIKLNKFYTYWNLCKGIFLKDPLQVSYFYQKKAQKRIDHIIAKHIPNRVYCQLIRSTKYLEKYTFIPKTVDLMDALSEGMKRRADTSLFWPLKKLYASEAKRLQEYEQKITAHFQHVVIISSQDRASILTKKPIQVIENGIDTDFYNTQDKTSHKPYELLFTGNMSYRPNIDAAQFLVRKILPLLQKKVPDLRILIAGAKPSREVRALEQKNVFISGWMDDIRDAYKQSRIFIAPLRLGSGLQNKLLEAMAMQMPCITTPLCNGALKAKEHQEILIAEKAEDFADAVLALLNDQGQQSLLGKKGRAHVQKYFNWESSSSRLARSIRNIDEP